MKIKEISISNIGGIIDLHLELNEKMNLICGPNGVGKTTILECIGHSFARGTHESTLKRNSSSNSGRICIAIEVNGERKKETIYIDDFEPDKIINFMSQLDDFQQNVISIKTVRMFSYAPLDSVKKDKNKHNYRISAEIIKGIEVSEVKNWFVNRYLYSAHPDALTENQIYNLEVAKSFFSLLDNRFAFSRIMASTNEIMVKTPSGEIYYEYLSSGFKSCLSILFGVIKDIEYRFREPTIKVDEFDGVILIDELDLHLHPEWQNKISKILKTAFPKVQFIATTHSPHVVQSANPEEIIALEFFESNIHRRKLPSSKYGFQGWTIDSNSRPVIKVLILNKN